MAFEQFTRCIEPSKFKERSFGVMWAEAGLVAAPFAALATGLGHWICLILVGQILGLAFLILYCRNFLFERLICLGGDRSVIGAVVSISSPPGVLKFDWDNDYSLNLLLQNTEFGVTQQEAEATPPFGELIAPQDVITNPPVSRQTVGGRGLDEKGTGSISAVLHVEFEGAGVYNMMKISEGMLGFAIGAFFLCLLAPWPIDLILSLFTFLAALLGVILSKFIRPGSPSDVDPALGTIHINEEDNGGLGKGADVFYVEGTWVFDPLHEGWNELHPVKVCTKMGCWNGDWNNLCCDPTRDQPTPPDIILRLKREFELARAEETLANQARPEYQWRLHPDLDGCSRDIIL